MFPLALVTAAMVALTCAVPPIDAVIHGHRGSGGSHNANPYAENTLPSIQAALEAGADFVEVDVHLSADGKVVLLHDFELDKTTDLSGCVGEKTYAELATADATVGSNAAAAVGIPLLAEALDVAQAHGGGLNIELKVNDVDGECAATDIAALVAAMLAVVSDANMRDAVMVSSFSFAALQEIKRLAPLTKVGFLSSSAGDDLLAAAASAKNAGFEAINPLWFGLTQDAATFDALRTSGLEIHAWTINDETPMETLLRGQVDGIITDQVDTAFALRARLQQEQAELTCGVPEPKAKSMFGCASAPGAGPPMFPLALAAIILIFRAARRKGTVLRR